MGAEFRSTAIVQSPLGDLLLAASSEGISEVWLPGQWPDEHAAAPDMRAAPGVLSSSAEGVGARRALEAAEHWFTEYFAGGQPDLASVPLNPMGTVFRQRVWAKLQQIPYGNLTTYGSLARTVAHEMGRAAMASQAIGGAVGHNPIPILIPCHRVVGSHGTLTGYSGGMATKVALLELEGVDVAQFADRPRL